jgi:hypothetical protein
MQLFLELRKRCDIAFWRRYLWALLLASTAHAQPPNKSVPKDHSEEYVLLGLVGYNYTDRHISEYSVNGASGGHINLSSPTSGGSGGTCCLKILKHNSTPIQVMVRWQVDGCMELERNPRTGATGERPIYYYKERYVDVESFAIKNPAYVETHFHPNGRVQVRLVEHESSPILARDEKRPDKSFFPRCENGKNGK